MGKTCDRKTVGSVPPRSRPHPSKILKSTAEFFRRIVSSDTPSRRPLQTRLLPPLFFVIVSSPAFALSLLKRWRTERGN